jgi:hypothetical protein
MGIYCLIEKMFMNGEKISVKNIKIDRPTKEKKDFTFNLNENFDWDFIFDREWLRIKK